MPKTTPPSSSGDRPATRRDRRAAARAERRATIQRAERRRPLLWLTVAAAAAGVLLIAGLVLAQPRTPATLQTPVFMTPTSLADGTSLGAKDAPVTLDLWADFQCPICQQFTTQIEPQLVDTYVQTGKVRLVFHDLAFIGPESVDAAIAAQAAAEQGKFWPYHDYLYANQGATENSGAFTRDRLIAIADTIGLDQTAFVKALDDPSLKTHVQDELTQGQSLGVNATPTEFLNGKLFYAGLPTWSQLSSAIDQLLPAASAGASTAPSPSA